MIIRFRSVAKLNMGFPGGSVVKNLPAMQETRVRSLGWVGPVEEGMATHSGMLAWRIPWTEESGGLQSVGHTASDMADVTKQQQQKTNTSYIFPSSSVSPAGMEALHGQGFWICFVCC